MSENQGPDVIIRGPSKGAEEAAHKKSQAIKAYLAEYDKPEDHKLSKGEEDQLARFLEAKKHIATIADSEEAHQEESTLGLKIHDWVTGNDLTFRQSDLEFDEKDVAGVDYIRAIVKRRRNEAAVEAGLL